MGLFSSSSGDTSGSTLNLGTGGNYDSKLRSPSSEVDLSFDHAGSTGRSSLDSVGGDVQMGLQAEQQKANMMSQVWIVILRKHSKATV